MSLRQQRVHSIDWRDAVMAGHVQGAGCGLPDVSRAHTSNHYRVSTWRAISPTISRVSSVALHHGGTGISSTARAEVNVLARGKCLAEGKAV